MPLRAALIITVRVIILAGLVWFVWRLVQMGLPLSWVAVFFGGVMAFSALVGLLFDAPFRRAFPGYYAQHKAVFGYSLSPRVLLAIRIAYAVLGAAALAWGLTALP